MLFILIFFIPIYFISIFGVRWGNRRLYKNGYFLKESAEFEFTWVFPIINTLLFITFLLDKNVWFKRNYTYKSKFLKWFTNNDL